MKSSAIAIFLWMNVALATVIPLPPGPFSVQLTTFELVDNDRRDPFNETHYRRLMVSELTPITKCDCIEVCTSAYMPADSARIEDEILLGAIGDLGWPRGVLASLEIESCCKVSKQDSNLTSGFPTVLFGPGLNTTRLFYTATAMHLASMGYQVYTLDHPYETDLVQFPNGDIIFGGKVALVGNDTSALEFGLDVRTEDVSFVMDALHIDEAVYMGHSFGGASAAAAMLNETRIAGGVNLDGSFWGRVQDTGVPRPFLNFGGPGHNSTGSPDGDPSWARFVVAMDENHPDVWYRELNVDGSMHNSFWDLPLIADLTGLSETEPLLNEYIGTVGGERILKILREYLSDFVDFALGGSEGLLAEPSDEYPDVTFLR